MDAVPPVLTIEQVARLFQTSRATIYRLARAGRISFIKLGGLRRFATKDIEDRLGFPVLVSHLAKRTSCSESELDGGE